MKLEGKIAIVTGSARGIGEAIAKKFAAEGASIVVNALHIEGANRVAEEIQNQGGQAIAVKADVSIKTEVQDLVRKTIDHFGKVDILVNNAGVTRRAPILEMTEKDWDLVQNIDLKGVFLCIQAVLGHMLEQRYGKIINISSMAALGSNNPGTIAYASAKAGVIVLTKVTAREAGPYGINVNCIVPGRIVTDMIFTTRTKEEAEKFLAEGKKWSVLGRIGKPEDIANLALFLASEDSSFMTGQIIRMDGGRGDLL